MAIAQINGTDIFYKTVGEGLPCLVMHGGLGFDHTYIHPFLDSLGDTFELIYYDHRGNGRSGRPDKETLTHTNFAADAAALATHLGHKKVAVLGHSYGGFIAMEMALRDPDRISHLILLDTAPTMPSSYSDELQVSIERKGATDEMRAVIDEEWATNQQMQERFPIILPLYFKKYDPVIGARLLENSIISLEGRPSEQEMSAYNVTPHLGEIHVPTLVLVGRDDWICPPSQAHIIHEGISGSELAIFENSGHFPYVEESDLFIDTIRDWIKRHS